MESKARAEPPPWFKCHSPALKGCASRRTESFGFYSSRPQAKAWATGADADMATLMLWPERGISDTQLGPNRNGWTW
jgi:hypothetical protein